VKFTKTFSVPFRRGGGALSYSGGILSGDMHRGQFVRSQTLPRVKLL